MKRLCAGLLCLLMFLTAAAPAAVLAEETIDTGTAETTGSTSSGTETAPPTTAGRKEITLRVSVENGFVLAVASAEGGAPEGLLFTLTVDGDEKETKQAEANGHIRFAYPVQTSDRKFVVSTEGDEQYLPATASKTVSYTPEELLGFSFSENRDDFDGESGRFYATWNSGAAPGVELRAVQAAGRTYPNNGAPGIISVTLPGVPFGRSKLAYIFSVPGQDQDVVLPVEDLVRGGTTAVHITLSSSNGRITAKVTDSLGGPVPDHPLVLTVGSTTLSPQKTDAQGELTFSGLTVTAGTAITCTAAARTTADGVTYQAASASLSGGEPTGSVPPIQTQGTTRPGIVTPPPATRKNTTATGGEKTTATTKTYALHHGAGTTSVEDSHIVVNVSFDEGVVKQFGLKNQDFEGKARFLLPKDTYAELVTGNGSLMMTARYSPIQVTNQQISAAISNLSKYSLYHAESIERVTLDLALLFANADGTEAEVTVLPDADYIVQLPIPASMKDVTLLAVSATNEEGIATPVEIKAENGYLRFNTKYLTTFTILGFTEAKEAPINKIPTLVVVLFAVGIVLLAGACLLMYFFVFRKPDDGDLPPEGGADPGDPSGPDGGDPAPDSGRPLPPPSPADMEDLYSSDSRRPQPPASNPPPASGVSLGSIPNRPVPPRGGEKGGR